MGQIVINIMILIVDVHLQATVIGIKLDFSHLFIEEEAIEMMAFNNRIIRSILTITRIQASINMMIKEGAASNLITSNFLFLLILELDKDLNEASSIMKQAHTTMRFLMISTMIKYHTLKININTTNKRMSLM